MLPTAPQSKQVTPTPPAAPKKEDSCLNNRLTKIALAVIASLVTFVFLPMPAAFAITAVVTIGAILCTEKAKSSKAPGAAAPAQSAQPANSVSTDPIKIRELKDPESWPGLALIFQSPEAMEEFVRNHGEKFDAPITRPRKGLEFWICTTEEKQEKILAFNKRIGALLFQILGEKRFEQIV